MATFAVFVLVSIALTGIVLALRWESTPASPTTQEAKVEMTSGSQIATAGASGAVPTAPAAVPSMSGVQFAESSDDLPDGAGGRLVRLATGVKAQRKGVFIGALATAGAHNEESLALARKRLAAVRRVLQANGLAPDGVHVQISQVAPGATTPTRLALVDLMVR